MLKTSFSRFVRSVTDGFVSLQLALLLLGGVAHADIPGTTRVACTPTPSFKCNTAHLDGNDGTAAIPLTWGTVAAVSVATNNTGSINLCSTYLTQAGSPNATISYEPGYTAVTGFTLGSTDNCILSWANPAAVSGLLQIRATRLTQFATTNQFRVEAITPPAGDVTAPPVPLGCTTVGVTSAVQVTCEASNDPYVGQAPSGLASYDICKNGTNCQNVAGTAGLSNPVTLTNLGTLSPTPTCTQSGADYTLVGAGDIDGVDDLGIFCGAQFANGANPTFQTVLVDSITNSTNFAKGGVWVRDSLNANSRYIAIYAMRAAAGTVQIQTKSRPTDGGSATTINTIAGITLPIYLKIEETAVNTFTLSYSSNGNDWTKATTDYVLPISTTKYWGMLGTATTGSGGATATFSLKQFNLNNIPKFTYSYTTASTGTFTVRANDVAGNHSSFGAGVAGTPIAPAVPTLNYNPGHYARFQLGDTQAGILSKMADMCNEPAITGFAIYRYWKDIETSKGSYSLTPFYDPIFTKAAACGKKLILRVQDRAFGTTNPLAAVPAYISSENLTYFRTAHSAAGAAIWDQKAMVYLVNLYKKILDQYGANPVLTMLLGEETAIGSDISTTAIPYTASAYLTQEIYRAQQLRLYAPKISFGLMTNWLLGGVSNMQTYFATVDTGIALNGGPDALCNASGSSSTSDGQDVEIGTVGGIDYRNTNVNLGSTELSDWGRNATPLIVNTKMQGTYHVNYMIWVYATTGTVLWPEILTFIQGHPITHTSCPTGVTQGCN